MTHRIALWLFALSCAVRGFPALAADGPVQISGIYPHLTAFNEHGECGIGAVVPWAGKLWYITYPPHFRTGSTDKLYEVDDAMGMKIRPESVGGTHANRFVHKESNQLVIGPYFIDEKGGVRAADVKKLVGRLTATARHLTDPSNKVYFVDMEGPVWEVDVKTLEPKRLFVKPLPGWHAKGAYSGQGVLVYSNNGESKADQIPGAELPYDQWTKGPEDAGALGEWDGKDLGKPWKVVSRRQHVEVSGPGGIYGPRDDADPIWSSGWDKRSLLLHVRDAKNGAWHLYRLPKASHTYDPKHGWYTEWPRIREIAPAQGDKPARLMMTMHGMMFDFPQAFAPGKTAGLRPINSYLRYVPDFCHWNGRVVLASDDTSIMQNALAGVSQSNLWFGKAEQLGDFGPASGWGGVWMGDAVKAGQPSDPYLFAGFAKRVLHVAQRSGEEVTITLEVDERGDGQWKPYTTVKVPANGYAYHVVPPNVAGEWVRLVSDKDSQATAYFHYATPLKHDGSERERTFAALTQASDWPGDKVLMTGGIVRPGKNRNLQFLTRAAAGDVLYEVDEKMAFKRIDDPAAVADVRKVGEIQPPVFSVDEASVVITTNIGRLRLPKGDPAFDRPGPLGEARSIREVASERNLANVHGTFYEIPRGAENAAGKADWKSVKPVASHKFGITDFCTWRGLLVLAGTKAGAKPDGQYFKAADGDAGLWFGQIDDLWRLGKPVGRGGPWKDTQVKANEPSDAYLMTNYDRKSLTITHDAKEPVTFTVQVDPSNTGFWHPYAKLTAAPGEPLTHAFPDGYGAYWVRLVADKPCKATATFVYE
jgi:hypothetical protein